LVERGPEKAGVGGSIPSLATNTFNNLATAGKACKIFSREQYANIELLTFHFWRRSLKTVVNPFFGLDRFTQDHRTLNQPRACSRWQLQAAEWTARTAV
jgi:hypothetical protein